MTIKVRLFRSSNLIQLRVKIIQYSLSFRPRASELFGPMSYQARLNGLQSPDVEVLVSFFSISGLYSASGGIEGVTVQAGGSPP